MNKIVLITGATSGIGLACARKFAENGDKLILTGRNVYRLAEVSKHLTEKGADVLTLAFDVRDRLSAAQCIHGLPAQWQQIDVLVNNAGLALGLEPEYEGSPDDWETMIDTNIKGLLTMTRLVVPGMVERNCVHNYALLNANDEVKFVVGSRGDFDHAVGMIEKHRLTDRGCELLVSPVWGKTDLQELAAWVLDSGLPLRMQIKMHKVIWGDRRGV